MRCLSHTQTLRCVLNEFLALLLQYEPQPTVTNGGGWREQVELGDVGEDQENQRMVHS
jgi:hypothetical protein